MSLAQVPPLSGSRPRTRLAVCGFVLASMTFGTVAASAGSSADSLVVPTDVLEPAERGGSNFATPPTSTPPTSTPTSGDGTTTPPSGTPTTTAAPTGTPTTTDAPGTPSTPNPPPPAPVNGRVLAAVASPAVDSTVAGFVAIELGVAGPVDALKWYVGDSEIGYSGNGEPWLAGWDSSTVANGPHELYSKAKQVDTGRWFTGPKITVFVNNQAGSGSTEAAPTGDLPGWNHAFVDDFTTDVARGQFPAHVSNKWSAYPSPWSDTSGKGMYDPERVVSIDNGVLTKSLRTEGGQALVTALRPKLTDTAEWGSLYGRYSVRFRADQVEGYKVAWLLWPDEGTNTTGSASGTGGNGEIDFPEMNLDSDHVMGFVHHQDATVSSDQYWSRSSIDISSFHTYTIEWSPNLVVFELDGVEVGRTTERVPNTAMHWVLQTETTLSGSTPANASGEIEIDWVSFWEYSG